MKEKIRIGDLEIDDIFFFKRIYRKREEVLQAVKIEPRCEHMCRCMIQSGRDAGTYESFRDDSIVEIEVEEFADATPGVSE